MSKLSIFDIIKSGGSGRDTNGEGTLNSGDNIYNKIFKINDNPTVNPYNETTDKNLYTWYDTFKSNTDMSTVFTYFTNILTKITPQILFSHKNRNNYFNNYIEAKKAGVNFIAYRCYLSSKEIKIEKKINIINE